MKTCFLIAPIGEPQSAARKRTDKLEKFILKSTLTQLGYSLTRADRPNSTGIITGQIVRELLSADLVIADITDHNPNVFYEMGIRHATRRPIIHLRHKDVTIPFDTASMRTFEYSFDVEDRPACIKALSEALSTLQPSSENPFSAATQSYLVIRGEALHSRLEA